MSIQRVVYESAKMTFGLGHFIFSTAAELCLEAEVQVVNKTGHYDYDQKKMVKLLSKKLYKEGRRSHSDSMRTDIKKATVMSIERFKELTKNNKSPILK